MNIMVIDNNDSFTYNIVAELEKRKCDVMVYRNTTDIRIIDNTVKTFKPKLILISSGPGAPKDSGISLEIIGRYWQKIPILGISLGCLCIVEVFGGRVDKAFELVHGKSSLIEHDNGTIFKDISNPFRAARYHSLAAAEVPYSLEISARTENGIVMGVRHKEAFVEGVQFHPESILTPSGYKIIDNLLESIKKTK